MLKMALSGQPKVVLSSDHRKNAAAAIEGAVTTACEALRKQKDIADEELSAKL